MSNALSNETSPYLLQHAENPVNWIPWSEESLSLARREDKPVLLSIGYAACHWCHVMERESFEDPATAEIMNRYFICIKVDREERPDLDQVYQSAYQMLNQKPGGWPLNMFLNPSDQIPFFGGTYFPPEARYGMPAFKEILRRIHTHFHEHRDGLQQLKQQMTAAFADMAESNASSTSVRLNDAPLERAALSLLKSIDSIHGGFGSAPKFPHPTNLERCIRHAYFCKGTETAEKLLAAIKLTLNKMSEGGLNDHIGGGFYRYSTDEQWMIPHFEKMLYDNAQLIPLYLDAAALCNEPVMLNTAGQTCDWVIREMQSDDGGYYSSLDADSEGVEGLFYIWQPDQIKGLVSPLQWKLLKSRYRLSGKPNFEGQWHLHASQSTAAVANTNGIDLEAAEREIRQALAILLEARNTRIRPGLDDKILTAWNGMMTGAMAQAGYALEKAEYVQSAENSLAFIRKHLWDGNRLKVTSRKGKSQLNAYLDDYALLATGIFELLKVRWSSIDMKMILSLIDCLLDHFEDTENGGFYFTSNDHEQLITRMKPDTDDAIPSGNGIVAQLLITIGHITGEPRYIRAAEKTLHAMWHHISRYPAAHGSLLTALEKYLYPAEIIILRGETSLIADWKKMTMGNCIPDRVVLAIPSSAEQLPGLLAAKTAPEKGVLAYPCRGTNCQAPISEINEFKKYLSEKWNDKSKMKLEF